jgi:hypothetical protein
MVNGAAGRSSRLRSEGSRLASRPERFSCPKGAPTSPDPLPARMTGRIPPPSVPPPGSFRDLRPRCLAKTAVQEGGGNRPHPGAFPKRIMPGRGFLSYSPSWTAIYTVDMAIRLQSFQEGAGRWNTDAQTDLWSFSLPNLLPLLPPSVGAGGEAGLALEGFGEMGVL